MLYQTTTTTCYGPKRLFIDMANGKDVLHYCLHYIVDTLGIDPIDVYPFKIQVLLHMHKAHKRVKLSAELKKEPTEKGFQYVCKEVSVPLNSQGFTPEELAGLHENSNVCVKLKK